MNSFAMLMNVLDERADIRKFVIEGEEMNRIAKIFPASDGNLRLLYWRGCDPDPNNLQAIADDLISHLNLS